MKKIVYLLLACVVVFPFPVLNYDQEPNYNKYVYYGAGVVVFCYLLLKVATWLKDKIELNKLEKEETQRMLEKIPVSDLTPRQREIFEKINTAVKNNDFQTLKEMVKTVNFSTEDQQIIEQAFEKVKNKEELSPEEKELFDRAVVKPLLKIHDKIIPEKKNLSDNNQEKSKQVSQDDSTNYNENLNSLKEIVIDSQDTMKSEEKSDLSSDSIDILPKNTIDQEPDGSDTEETGEG